MTTRTDLPRGALYALYYLTQMTSYRAMRRFRFSMGLYDRNPDYAIVFALGMIAGLVWAVICMLLMNKGIIDAGHIVTFAATSFAVGGAIVGSVLIEGYKKRTAVRDRHDFITEAIDKALVAARGFTGATGAQMRADRGVSSTQLLVDLRASLEWLQAIREWYPPDNMQTLRAYEEIRSIGPNSLDEAEQNARLATIYDQTPMTQVVESLDPITSRLMAAKALLSDNGRVGPR